MKKYLFIVLLVGVCFSKNIDHNYDLDSGDIFRDSRLIKNMIDNKPIKLESFNVKMDTIVYNFGKPSKKRRGSITKKISMEGDELSSYKFYYSRNLFNSKYAKKAKSTILKSNRKVKYKYDKSGNIIEKVWISDDDKNNAITTLEYDSKNRLINETGYDRYGKISINTILDYDETNSWMKKKWEMNGVVFESDAIYDKDELLYSIVHSLNGRTINIHEYKYDKNNNIVKIVNKKNANDDSIWKEEEFLWEDGFITKISVSIIGSELDNLPKKDKLYLVKEYNISKYKYYDISNGDYDKGNRSGTWIKYSGTTKQIEYTYQNKSPNMWHRNYDYVKYQKGKVIKKGQYRKGRLDGNFEEYDKKTYALISAGSYLNGKKEGNWKYYSKGQLKKEGSYSKGKENGSWTYYDSNSSAIDSVGNYLNGEKDNVWKYYYTNSSGESDIEKEVTYSNNQIKSKKIFTAYKVYIAKKLNVYEGNNRTDDSFYEIVYDSPGSSNYIRYNDMGVKVARKNDFLYEKFNDQGELLNTKYIGKGFRFFKNFPHKYGDRQYSGNWKPDNFPSLWAKGEVWRGYMVGEWSFYYQVGKGYNYRENEKMPLYTKILYNQSDGSKRNDFDIPLSGIKENQQIVTYHSNGQVKQKFMLWIDSDSLKYHDKYEEWYDNGQLKKRFKYEKGHLIGLAEIWYKNGNKAVEGKFKYPGIYEEKNSFKSWHENGETEEISNLQQFIVGTGNNGNNYTGALHYNKKYKYDENGNLTQKNKWKKWKNGDWINENKKGRKKGMVNTIKGFMKWRKKVGDKSPESYTMEIARKGLEKNYYNNIYQHFSPEFKAKKILVYNIRGIKVYCKQFKKDGHNMLSFELEDSSKHPGFEKFTFRIKANVKGDTYNSYPNREKFPQQYFTINRDNNLREMVRTYEDIEIENIKLEKRNFY